MVTKEESKQLRREVSQYGQFQCDDEMTTQQCLDEGLSIITDPTNLSFRHNKLIYINPEMENVDEIQ